MTKPDKARTFAELAIRCGKTSVLLEEAGEEAVNVAEHGYKIGYRAGQAASAERIKALEAGVSDAIAYVEFQRPNAVDLDQLLFALRALLKEADQ
jgi:hypothetical protein